ncbi:hypothetical protein L9G74_18530 [Shewanella sp. C32]|uniref:ABC transporter permease n=1 Tax=Shewanella electrica TaxID=515560 RepID=A0ABT2FR81_9GAMM|nr:hypothetical protein [Shewanella electrica]MCH1925736.1 hypothetical protein [Shewanella electrica]MCS4558437.1 hypothetical protein [Shewanella electrica]
MSALLESLLCALPSPPVKALWQSMRQSPLLTAVVICGTLLLLAGAMLLWRMSPA